MIVQFVEISVLPYPASAVHVVAVAVIVSVVSPSARAVTFQFSSTDAIVGSAML